MKVTDLIVIAGALGGLAIILLGLAQFDPRIRNRFSSGEVSVGRRAATASIMVVVGAALVLVALGGFEGDGNDASARAADKAPDGPAPIEFVATDYEFTGPDVLAEGRQEVTLRNEGEEPHEIFIQRLGADAPEVPKLLKMSDKQSERYLVGEGIPSDRVAPGGSVTLSVDLEPGRYGYVCFVGTKKSEMPHAFLGMHGEFTVE